MALLSSATAKYKGVLFVCGVGLVAFAVSTVYGTHSLLSFFQMRVDYQLADRSVTELQQDNARLQERIHQLETDNRYIEKVARERLGMVKPGEVLYRLKEPAPEIAAK